LLGSFPLGFVDVDGPLLSGGAFHKGVSEDSIHFPVLDKGATRVFIRGPGLPLYPNLRGQFRIEDELSEISFIDQVLQVLSESSAVHCAVDPPFMEGTIVPRTRPFQVGGRGLAECLTHGWSSIVLKM